MYIILIFNKKKKTFHVAENCHGPRTAISTMECLKVLSCTSSEYSAKEQVSVIHKAQLKAHLEKKFK